MRRLVISTLLVLAFACAGLGWLAMTPAQTTSETEALGAPVLSPRRVPVVLAAAASDAAARADANRLVDATGGQSCVVIHQGQRPILARDPGLPLIPASTLKLLTASAAIDALGPDHRFQTEVRAANDPKNGVVNGPLYLVGDGDPLLLTNDYAATLKERKDVRTSLEALADAVVAEGVKTVRGGVVGDDRRFDGQRYIPTWEAGYAASGQVGPTGALLVNQGFTKFTGGRASTSDPATHAASVFTDLLRPRGVEVQAGPGPGALPAKTETIAEAASPPLTDLIAEMLTESDNTTAEVLLKAIAAEGSGRGTTIDGVRAALDALARQGVDTKPLTLVDGSGLDRSDRATCAAVSRVMRNSGPDGALAAGLARAGETGTLAKRMNGTAAVGRVQAKTGTLAGVSALAGWARPEGQTPISFSVVTNGVNTEIGRQLEDRLAALLAARGAPAPDYYAPEAVQGE